MAARQTGAMGGRLAAVALAGIGVWALCLAPSRASAFNYMDSVDNGFPPGGDLIGVWSKNGTDLIVDFGPVGSIHAGDMATVVIPTQFSGSFDGAKFNMFAVPNLEQELPGFPGVTQENIVLTSPTDPTSAYLAVPDGFTSIGQSFAQLNNWFEFLNSAPAVDGTTVFENGDDRLVVKNGATGTTFQYETQLGLGTDKIANTALVSTATPIAGDTYSAGLYQITKNAAGYSDTESLFSVQGDSATGEVQFVPEPGFLVLLASGIAGQWLFGRRRVAARPS